MPLLSSGSRTLTCFAYLVLSANGLAQAQPSDAATVTFSCDFPGSNPSRYRLSVSSTRQVSYSSDGKLSSSGESDSNSDAATPGDDSPFRMDFTISAATAERIFSLAKAAHYFEGNIDSGKKNIASTGAKTLAYRDLGKSTSASYNYSPIPAVQQLTAVFQNLSGVVEFGRRLDYEYHYQKLALDDEMKRMESITTLQDVGPDLPDAAPVLQKIADDPSVINPVRARAMRLLHSASTPGK